MVVPKSYKHKDFSKLIRKKRPDTEQSKKPSAPKNQPEPPVPAPSVTDASRQRDRLMGNPEYRFVYNKSTKMYHDRDCVRVKYIANVHFDMVKEFPPVESTFCFNCYRKALIRAGVGPHSKWIPVASVVLDRLSAGNNDLHRLFITNCGSIIDVDWEKTAVCFQVGEDQWVVHKQEDGTNVLLHNNYEIVPSGERIFFDGFHVQEDLGDHSFKNHARIMCLHQRREYEYEDNTEVKGVIRALRRREMEDLIPTTQSDTSMAYPWLQSYTTNPGYKSAVHAEAGMDHLIGLIRTQREDPLTPGARKQESNTGRPASVGSVSYDAEKNTSGYRDETKPRINRSIELTHRRPKMTAGEIASENLLREALGLALLEYEEEEEE